MNEAATAPHQPASKPLDLSLQAIASWVETGPPGFSQVVAAEEAVETWAADRPLGLEEATGDDPEGEIDAAVVELGRALQSNPTGTLAVLEDTETRERLQIVLSYLRASRRLRTVSWLVERFGAKALPLLEASPRPHAGTAPSDPPPADPASAGSAVAAAIAIRASLELVRRHHLLCAMFDPRRIRMVSDAIDDAQKRLAGRIAEIGGSGAADSVQ